MARVNLRVGSSTVVSPRRPLGSSSRAFPEERITIQIEQTDWLKKTGRRKITDLGAFLTQAIRDDYARPEGFVSAAEKAERQRAANERRKQEAAEARRKRERAKQREEEQAKVEEYWDGLTGPEKEALKAEALAASDPENVRIYEQARSTQGPMADVALPHRHPEPLHPGEARLTAGKSAE